MVTCAGSADGAGGRRAGRVAAARGPAARAQAPRRCPRLKKSLAASRWGCRWKEKNA